MTKIVLDAESFKALASDTRLQILKALDARPLTVSEMSRLLDLNKATVFEHLKQLMAAELAKREDDPARKWVYYKLTWKGRNVLHPENAQIFLLLGLGAFGVGGAILQSVRVLTDLLSGSGGSEAPADDALGPEPNQRTQADVAAQSGSPENASAPAPPQAPEAGATEPVTEGTGGPDWLLLGALAVLLALISLIAWTLYSRQRQERRSIQRLIDQLPANVNAGEAPPRAA